VALHSDVDRRSVPHKLGFADSPQPTTWPCVGWGDEGTPTHQNHSEEVLGAYEQFLDETNAKEEDLVARLQEPANRARMFQARDRFGELMFRALQLIGAQSVFHRMLVV
jgi:hypothetical protein